MALSKDDRTYVVQTASELLRSQHRKRLLRILENRLRETDGYPDEHERELDRVVLAVATVVDDELDQ